MKLMKLISIPMFSLVTPEAERTTIALVTLEKVKRLHGKAVRDWLIRYWQIIVFVWA